MRSSDYKNKKNVKYCGSLIKYCLNLNIYPFRNISLPC
jgi:hypothetical protein